MLQQTQVQTVLPYYRRWMEKLPDIEAVNRASEDEVLKLWQGLGYYSRARNIKKGAEAIVAHHGGRIPSDYERLIKVPGIGDYTAGAILSLAYNKKFPIADGNILRVLARVFAVRKPIDQEATRKEILKREETLLPDDEPGLFNEALMELGALVCLPKKPLCLLCPLQRLCLARLKGLQEKIPVKSRKVKIERVQALALILEKDRRFLIEKRPLGKIMGGLWEFPEWKIKNSRDAREKSREIFQKALKVDPVKTRFLKTIKRHYTHFAEDLHVYRAKVKKTPSYFDEKGWPKQWVRSEELDGYPFTSAHAKIRDLLKSGRHFW